MVDFEGADSAPKLTYISEKAAEDLITQVLRDSRKKLLSHVAILANVKRLLESKNRSTKGVTQIQEGTFWSALQAVAFKNRKNPQLWELRDHGEDEDTF